MQGMIGEIRLFGGDFAPRGWAFCDGQSMAIGQNAALFAVIGKTYGGDGVTNFNLPNIKDRAVIGTGPQHALGTQVGTASKPVGPENLPKHSHTVSDSPFSIVIPVNTGTAATKTPGGNFLAAQSADFYSAFDTVNGSYAPGSSSGATVALGQTGSTNISMPNLQPLLGLRYIIAIEGTYPLKG